LNCFFEKFGKKRACHFLMLKPRLAKRRQTNFNKKSDKLNLLENRAVGLVSNERSVKNGEAQGEAQCEDDAEGLSKGQPADREQHPQVVTGTAASCGTDELGDLFGCEYANQREDEADDEECGHGFI